MTRKEQLISLIKNTGIDNDIKAAQLIYRGAAGRA